MVELLLKLFNKVFKNVNSIIRAKRERVIENINCNNNSALLNQFMIL